MYDGKANYQITLRYSIIDHKHLFFWFSILLLSSIKLSKDSVLNIKWYWMYVWKYICLFFIRNKPNLLLFNIFILHFKEGIKTLSPSNNYVVLLFLAIKWRYQIYKESPCFAKTTKLMDLWNTFQTFKLSQNWPSNVFSNFHFHFISKYDLKPLSSIVIQSNRQTHKVHFKAHQLKDYKWYPSYCPLPLKMRWN